MLTLKFFNALVEKIKSDTTDDGLWVWARIEYKNDAGYAYYHIREHGTAPNLGWAL